MLSTLSQLLPILCGFLVGFVLQRTQISKPTDSEFLFKLIFYVCTPALIFYSLSTVNLSGHLLVFSLLAVLLYVIGFGMGKLMVDKLPLTSLQKPIFLIASMGLNSIFVLPYLQSLYGPEGIARFAAYDLANTILLYSWAYSIAVHANPLHKGDGILRKRLLRSPPLYAVVIGLVVNVSQLNVPVAITDIAKTFSAPTGFLVTVAIGMVLHPKRAGLSISLRVIAMRTITALAVGLAVISIFDLTGIDRVAVLLMAVAPVAFSSATFASLENLDVKFAAGTLSVSLAIGIVLTTAVAVLFA